jgi:hypothetical protein
LHAALVFQQASASSGASGKADAIVGAGRGERYGLDEVAHRMREAMSKMRGTLRSGLLVIAASLCMAGSFPVAAHEPAKNIPAEDAESASWYYPQPTYRPNPQAIIHEKAQTRALQRQSRLASLSWYGMSNLRPTAAPTPFTSRYSPVWEMPGGRPFAWHHHHWPTHIVYVR